MKLSLLIPVLLGLIPAAWGMAGEPTGEVEAAISPEAAWKKYATRSLDSSPDLAALPLDSELDRYGGWRALKSRSTGFFYTTNVSGRWWIVDPDGGWFINKGVTAVQAAHSPGAQPAFQARFGNGTNWAVQTIALLRQHGFNVAGAWSSCDELRSAPAPLVYTRLWNFMAAYGKKRGGTYTLPGHTGYPKDCIFVFDPEFEAFCDSYARDLAADKDDPWLLGHFSDNELPFRRTALANYLSLPPEDAGHRAALDWLRARHGPSARPEDATERDRKEFQAEVVKRYFRVVSRAIRKYDPNHLFLGSRFHGSDVDCPEVFRAAGPYLDVASVNYYMTWTPRPSQLEMWAAESGRPVIITEWYAKANDTGLSNRSGAGWVVKTQRDRGLFYQNFTLGLLQSPACVGWHWFRYIDNDPLDTKSDPSNRDANKGIVTIGYEPYTPLLDAMRQINERSYALAEYFQKTRR
jgi:hypothetical protein